MIDITFGVCGNEYRLTSDERQYILQQFKGVSGPDTKNPGEKLYSTPHYFGDLRHAFRYIAVSYPRTSDSVISSLEDLERVHGRVNELCEVMCEKFKTKFEMEEEV